MTLLKHASLFSGIGGFDLAAEWSGWENIFHCEWNPFGQKILNYYWPKAKNYEDITKTDFTRYRGKVDVLTGGFPCQPFSVAGKRSGSEDDRYLWPEMLRAIDQIRPPWVVGENVTGIVTMVQPGEITKVEGQASLFEEDYSVLEYEQDFVIETICRDLERIGYKVYPIIIPACAVGAPHRRDRVWFMAHSTNSRIESMCERKFSTNKHGTVTDTNSSTERSSRKSGEIEKSWSKNNDESESRGTATEQHIRSYDVLRYSSNSNNSGLQRGAINGSFREIKQERDKQSARFLPPDWEKFPTQSPIRNGDDGISSRLDGITFSKWREESIKGGGNAIVPQVAYEIFEFINELSAL